MGMYCECLFKIFTNDMHLNIKYLHDSPVGTSVSVFVLRTIYSFWKNGKKIVAVSLLF